MSRVQKQPDDLRSNTISTPPVWVKHLRAAASDYVESAEQWQATRRNAVRVARESLEAVGRDYVESAEKWQATRRKAVREVKGRLQTLHRDAVREYVDDANRWQDTRREAVREARELLRDMKLHPAVLEIERGLRRYLAGASWRADRALSEPPPGSPFRKAIWKLAKATNGVPVGVTTIKQSLELPH